jgi:dihydropteroate synthase
MGVINLSDESFFGGSIIGDPAELEKVVLTMDEDGADLIDVGGASTAPARVYGTPEISVEEEIERISAAIPKICKLTSLPISIDTVHAPVAERAIDLGVSIVNDISGLQNDSKMSEIVAAKQVPVIIMANCGEPCKSLKDAIESLKRSIAIARTAGIDDEHIIVDPGIGFGKLPEVDFELIRGLEQFLLLGHPLCVGVSRKAFLGALLEQPDPTDRLTGTIAATSISVVNGADIIRAHDVTEARIATRVGESLRQSGDGP